MTAAEDGRVQAAEVCPDYGYFKREFEQLSGICLDFYKENQMRRRINTLIERKGKNGYEDLLTCLRTDPSEMAQFLDYITINVTEFFRTPEQWTVFEIDALSDLVKHAEAPLKIWSTACSTGEEAWSLAMSLRQLAGPERFQILATDLDETVLQKAEKGVYCDKSVEAIPSELCTRFFTRTGSGWRVSDELRSCVEFRKLDLLKDVYPSDCDLILCRNVLIYFTEEAKDRIYTRFHTSLKPDGYLFTGNTEQIIYYKKYGMRKIRNYLYQNTKLMTG